MASLISSLAVATRFLLLRHLPDASPRGIGNPLRTTSRKRLSLRWTSNILVAPHPRPRSRVRRRACNWFWQLFGGRCSTCHFRKNTAPRGEPNYLAAANRLPDEVG